jgi:hypothetical protein
MAVLLDSGFLPDSCSPRSIPPKLNIKQQSEVLESIREPIVSAGAEVTKYRLTFCVKGLAGWAHSEIVEN